VGQLSWEHLALVVVALMGCMSTLYASHLGRESAHEKTEVDSESVETAARMQIDASYKGIIDALSGEIRRLNDKLVTEIAVKDKEIERLRSQLAEQSDQLKRHEEVIDRLTGILTAQTTRAAPEGTGT